MKVVVLTCDQYRWIVPLFKYFYKKYWPDSPYQTEVVTEREHIDGATFYAGKRSWANMLIHYLNQSKENKILFMLEDYMIKTKVDTQRVKVAERLCKNDIGCVRLSNGPYKYFRKHTARSPVIEGFREYPLHERFSMVIQVAFFQKQFLIDVLKGGEDVWFTEKNGSKRLAKLKSKWRILWPEKNVIDYMSNGGLMKKGKMRPQASRWIFSELLKDASEA